MASEYHLIETRDESFQQISEPSPVTTVEPIERLDHRRESSQRKPLLHYAPVPARANHRHALVGPMRAPLRQTRIDKASDGSRRCRGLDAQRHRELVHRARTMLDEEIEGVHLTRIEPRFSRRPHILKHSACCRTAPKRPPGNGNAFHILLGAYRTGPVPHNASCPCRHEAPFLRRA
jgi:hypothetical protein